MKLKDITFELWQKHYKNCHCKCEDCIFSIGSACVGDILDDEGQDMETTLKAFTERLERTK